MKVIISNMSIKSPNTIALLLIVLITGSGIGYYIGQQPVSQLQDQINDLNQNITELNTSVDQLSQNYVDIEEDLQIVENHLADKENELNNLNAEYNNLQNSYNALITLIPYQPIDAYTEAKSTTEGTSIVDLVGKCGEDYIIPAPVNAENWEINITIVSELSTQAVHITLYQLVGEYPPDYSAQPLAPHVSGTGTASISVTLDPAYAYVIKINDAYTKQFTGTIEEKWYPTLPVSTEIPGITNGDFSEGNEGWLTQGKSAIYDGAKHIYQRFGGTFLTQEINIEENQGLSFMVKPKGARFEVQIDGQVIYYGDLGDDEEWRNIIVPFGNTYLGPRDLHFIVCDGKDNGSNIALDDITMVQFETS